jgi:transcriptional regulator NrdR family protein
MINQLVGEVPRNHQIITDQLQAAVKAGQIQQNRADELADEHANKFRALQTLAVTGDDFAEMALQRYAKLNKKKLMGILKKASNDANVQAAAV